MKSTYDITIDVHDESVPVTLTQPTGLDVIVSGIEVPDKIEEGEMPETDEEREAYRTFAGELITMVSDLPKSMVEELPPVPLAKLIHASANVYGGNGPSLDEFDGDVGPEPSADDNGDVEEDVDNSHALTANSYPHFGTDADDTDGVRFDRQSSTAEARVRTVARGE